MVVVCILSTVIYLPGLSGPFLLDDFSNLQPLGAWLSGAAEWQDALLGNTSGPLSRPLSMASFMLDALLFGQEPLPFKITNLLIHIGCGALVFVFCKAILARDERLHESAQWWALGVSAVWLLHPLQVSTVLYVVQRMAQLSACCVLIALLCYLRGRTLLDRIHTLHATNSTSNYRRTRDKHAALAWLFVAFPLATLAAAAAKENGVLAPLLALVLELAYFRARPRPTTIRAFFFIFLLLPGILVVAWFALHIDTILASYETRSFTLTQRLLSQPRALLDYVTTLLFPRGTALGLYGDDFPISTNLSTPLSTVPTIAFWGVMMVFAYAFRNRSATFFAGVFLFLAGHIVESTALPLQLYFEHRNYLPSIGVFLAVASLIELGYARLQGRTDMARVLKSAGVGLILLLGIATYVRVLSWQSWAGLVTQAVASHPNSMRAQLDYAVLLVKIGKIDLARDVFSKLRSSPSIDARNVGAIYPIVLDCMTNGATSTEHLENLRTMAGNRLGGYESVAFQMLAQQLLASDCAGLSKQDFGALLGTIASRAPQNPSTSPVWTLHHIAADFFRLAGDLPRAREEALAAWSPSMNAPAGLLLVRVLTDMKQYAEAESLLEQVRPHIRRYDAEGRQALITAEAGLRSVRDEASEAAPISH